MIAVCCTEAYLSETSQQLADANLAALAALRLMETEQQLLGQGSSSGLLSSSGPQLSGQHASLYSTAAGSTSPQSQPVGLYSSAAQSLHSSQHATLQCCQSSSSQQVMTLNRRRNASSHSPHSSMSDAGITALTAPDLSSPVVSQPHSPDLASLSQSYSSRISHGSPATSPLRGTAPQSFSRQKSASTAVLLTSSQGLSSPPLPRSSGAHESSEQLSAPQLPGSAELSSTSLPPAGTASSVVGSKKQSGSQPCSPHRSTPC
jgi:hypothetical protein